MRERIPFDAKQKSGTAPDGSIPIDIYGITGGGGGGADWGQIGGTLADQTDLKTALDGKATSAQGAKADSAVQPAALTGLATETFVDNQIQGIEFPVSSVNGEQGLVILDAAKVGAVDIVSTPNRLLGTDGSGAQSSRAVADFATSAQGAKADSAVQPAAITGLVPNTRTVAGKPLTANVTLAAADVGAATTAQGAKADTAIQPAGLTKAAVGLGNVDNTSDANKPVSTAQATAIAAKVGSDGTVKNWVAVATVADLPPVGDATTFYIVTDILA